MSLFVLAAAVTAVDPNATPELDFTGLFIKMVVLLAIIVIVGFIVIRFVGKGGSIRGRNSGRHFELLSWFRLGHKNTLYIVRIGKRVFALGAGDQQVNVISEMQEDELES